MKDYTIAAIDVGSSKICTLVAETTQDEGLRVLGVGVTPSRGVKKGMVDNIQEATEAIDASVERAEKSSGTRIAARAKDRERLGGVVLVGIGYAQQVAEGVT